MDTSDDPVIASYDVFLTDSEISRYVLQYIDRAWDLPYDERHERKPAAFRLKPKTGNIEVDIPINTRSNYDQTKGLRYGNAMLRSRVSGGFGMAGGFSSGPSGSGSRVKAEADDAMDLDGGRNGKMAPSQDVLRVQTLGGRVKIPEEGDPVYMLAAFRGQNLYLSPVSAVVQLHPQLHHLDALDGIPAKGGRGSKKKEADEDRPIEAEARTVDVKVKGAEEKEAVMDGNLRLLKQMQDDKWVTYDWVDAETEEAWQTYESYMIHQNPNDLPLLQSMIDIEEYLDKMSAPRVDPARPEMTGWAMKLNRKQQRERKEAAGKGNVEMG